MDTLQRVCVCVAALALLPPPMTAAQQRTDVEIADMVLRDGPAAIAIRAQYEVVRREQLARLVHPNPIASYAREGAGFAEFFLIEQSLPLFGARIALRRAGVAAEEAAQAEQDARLWLLRARALDAASRVAARQQTLAAAEGARAQIEKLVVLLRIREREGEGSRFDRLRAEHELLEARQVAAAAAAELSEARAALAAMLPAGTGLSRVAARPVVAGGKPEYSALLTRATDARAELRALRRTGSRAELEAVAARRVRLPAPIVTGGVKRGDENGVRRTGAVFGVSASLPLFDAGGREAARWDAERMRADAERTAIEQEIAAQIRSALDILAARRDAAATGIQEQGADLAAIAEIAYREGEIGIFELLDAVRASARARTRDIEMALDLRLAEIALERAVGDVLWP